MLWRPGSRGMRVLSVGLLLVFLAGCGGQRFVKLRSTPKNPLAEQLRLTARGGPEPSKRTRQLLRRYALPTGRFVNTEDLIAKLAVLHDREPTAESCYALAELSYIAAAKMQLTDPHHAQEWYLKFGRAVVFVFVRFAVPPGAKPLRSPIPRGMRSL